MWVWGMLLSIQYKIRRKYYFYGAVYMFSWTETTRNTVKADRKQQKAKDSPWSMYRLVLRESRESAFWVGR